MSKLQLLPGYVALTDLHPKYKDAGWGSIPVACRVCAVAAPISSGVVLLETRTGDFVCRECATAGAIVRPLGVPRA